MDMRSRNNSEAGVILLFGIIVIYFVIKIWVFNVNVVGVTNN